ncbi:MAG: TolC family protein [Chitinophagales bacterium]
MLNLKKYFLLIILIPGSLLSQEINKLTLQQVYEMSLKNYPLIKQKDLVKQTSEISIENLQKGFLPQVTINGQATYQSDVIKFAISLPGFPINSLDKDQYKLYADVNQQIYDGGLRKQQKASEQLNAAVEDQKIEVELYKLKERINQVYLSILYLDEQLKQVELAKTDIQTGIKSVNAQVQNGTALKSNLNTLKAELLKADQRVTEVKASKKGLVDALSVFLGQPLNENIELEKPAMGATVSEEIVRPELKLFSNQTDLIAQQDKLITSKNLPSAGLFVQGGFGKPGLNPLKNEFDLYYMGGVRFIWALGGLYTKKKEKELVEVNKKFVDTQKETFLLNTNTQLKQQKAEIDKLSQLVTSDNEIIVLRKSVTDAAKAQLENGVITANDYIKEINAEDQARQSLITHQLLLLQAQINYQTISGKQ